MEASRGEVSDGPPPEQARANGDDDADTGQGRPTRRNLAGIALAAATLVVVTIAAATGGNLTETDPLEEDPASVELPDPEELDEGAGDRAPTGRDAPPGAAEEPEMTCEPDGCALWAIPRRLGPTTIVGSMLVMPAPGGDPQESEEQQARLQGFSLADGSLAWETGLGPSLGDSGWVGVSLHPLGGDHAVLGFGGSVALLDATDGTLAWVVDLDHDDLFASSLDDRHVLVFGEPSGVGGDPQRDGSAASDEAPDVSERSEVVQVTSSVIDRVTGELVWSEEGSRVVTVVGGHALLVDRAHTRVEARDIGTGDVAWEREVEPDPRRTLQGIDGERVVIFRRGGLQVVDAQDGRLVAEVAIDLSGDPHVQVVGDLVVVSDGAPGDIFEPSPRDGQLIDLEEPDAEPLTLDGLVQAAPLYSSSAHDAHTPWTRPTPTALALALQHDERYEFRVLEPDGTVRWSIDGEFEEPTCCVRVHPAGDEGRMILVLPSPEVGRPTIVSTEDGSYLATIELPDDVDPADPIRFIGDVAVAPDSAGRGVVLAGDAGHVRIRDGSPRYLGPPVPVVEGAAGLLGIDPAMLFDEGRLSDGGWRAGS